MKPSTSNCSIIAAICCLGWGVSNATVTGPPAVEIAESAVAAAEFRDRLVDALYVLNLASERDLAPLGVSAEQLDLRIEYLNSLTGPDLEAFYRQHGQELGAFIETVPSDPSTLAYAAAVYQSNRATKADLAELHEMRAHLARAYEGMERLGTKPPTIAAADLSDGELLMLKHRLGADPDLQRRIDAFAAVAGDDELSPARLEEFRDEFSRIAALAPESLGAALERLADMSPEELAYQQGLLSGSADYQRLRVIATLDSPAYKTAVRERVEAADEAALTAIRAELAAKVAIDVDRLGVEQLIGLHELSGKVDPRYWGTDLKHGNGNHVRFSWDGCSIGVDVNVDAEFAKFGDRECFDNEIQSIADDVVRPVRNAVNAVQSTINDIGSAITNLPTTLLQALKDLALGILPFDFSDFNSLDAGILMGWLGISEENTRQPRDKLLGLLDPFDPLCPEIGEQGWFITNHHFGDYKLAEKYTSSLWPWRKLYDVIPDTEASMPFKVAFMINLAYWEWLEQCGVLRANEVTANDISKMAGTTNYDNSGSVDGYTPGLLDQILGYTDPSDDTYYDGIVETVGDEIIADINGTSGGRFDTLDQANTDLSTQLSSAETNLGNALNAATGMLSSQLSTSTTNLSNQLTNSTDTLIIRVGLAETNLGNAIDTLADSTGASFNQTLDAIATSSDFATRLMIETHLSTNNKPLAVFVMPGSAGGYLDDVADIVTESIAMASAAGYNIPDPVLRSMDRAAENHASGDYKEAYTEYQNAYKKLMESL